MSDVINHFRTIDDIIFNQGPEPPIDITYFPNVMGINLCCVDGIAWSELKDGQLLNMTVYFKPDITEEAD